MNDMRDLLSTLCILIPLGMFLFSIFSRVFYSQNYSRLLSTLAVVAQLLLFLLSGALLEQIWRLGTCDTAIFSWFQHAKIVYQLNLHLDLSTGLFLVLAVFISGVIGRFSVNYLAYEEGYYKFFINFYLMQLALYTLILTSNFYFILVAWELLGLASIFLISFYQSSIKTVANALFVLGVYKFCDLFLILALLTFHREQHGFLVSSQVHDVSNVFLVFLILATLGKSAIFPFSKWVPRAMEGPTTSSAIFYGALSIHAGVILLMKFQLVFQEHAKMNILILVLGSLTAVYASLKSRIQTDAKSTLAYATVVQVGLIYMEFALGWYSLVILHTISNALLKTYQFIRTPSNIHHFHHLEKLNYKTFDPHGIHFEYLLPKKVRISAYKAVYHNFGLTLIWQMMLWPLRNLQQQLNRQVESLNQKLLHFSLFRYQSLILILGVGLVLLLIEGVRRQMLNSVFISALLLCLAVLFALISCNHSTISHYLAKIKTSYFLISASALIFFGNIAHLDAILYFTSNLASLFILDYFIKYLSRRLDLHDIRSYLGIGNRYKYINMIAIAIMLMLTFTPGFATFVIFDVILEDISSKSQWVMLLFLCANTLNIYSVFKFIFKIIFGASEKYLNEYPDFTRTELLKLSALMIPMVAIGILPFMIFH